MVLYLDDVQVEDTERVYIKQEGVITLKVVKVTEGKTTNNNDQIKVHFQDKAKRFAIDDFVITPNAMWRIKVLTKALKLPNVIDTNLFIDRYVQATFKAKKTPNGGVIYEIKKYEASPLTNTYEPPQQQQTNYQQQQQHQAPQQQNHQAGVQQELPPPIDIDEDEIPF